MASRCARQLGRGIPGCSWCRAQSPCACRLGGGRCGAAARAGLLPCRGGPPARGLTPCCRAQELPPLEPGAEGGGHDVSTMASLDPMGDDELAKGVSQRPSRMVSQADEEDVLTTRDGLMRRNSHDSSSAPV